MTGSVPTWLAVIQCVIAGVILGVCALHGAWSRADLRRTGAGWMVAWSLALAAVCLLNGLLHLLPSATSETLTFLRFCALAAAVTLSVPAVNAWVRGPRTRWFVVSIGLWYAVAAALWLGGELVLVEETAGGVPAYTTTGSALALLPVTAVAVYLLRAVHGLPVTVDGAVATVAGSGSVILLVVAMAPPASPLTEVLQGMWVLPLAVGLQVLATTRIAEVRRCALRRSRMRDAVASLANAAWLMRSPDQMLRRAVDEAREVLDGTEITGSMRPLAHDRFVTELYRADGRAGDPDEHAFLRDLARMVSGAAERQALTSRLRAAAFTDSLTELHNRHALDQHLREQLERAQAEGTRLAVLLCDIDDFRHINDRYGHERGDAVLLQAAAHLRGLGGRTGFVARHGADEFALVLHLTPDDEELRALARRARAELSPQGLDGTALRLSVGIAVWHPGDAVDADALLQGADIAMLEGKRSHTGIMMYDDALRARMATRRSARNDLAAGVAAAEMIGYFQPLTHATTLEVVGLEILARWLHDGKVLCPADWLPMAEETGLIVEIGKQMFRAARAGAERFQLPVAVNVAARQLDEPDFVQHVEESWGTDRWDLLTIEVTESALLYDAVHVRNSLDSLAERGVRIALDDFGTGYNSLSRLGELPLHVLKIDRTFVQDIGSVEGAAVLRAIIALAEAHGLEVVAEGVEQVAELTALVGMGVGVLQGHMLGRPAPTLPTRGLRPDSAWALPRRVSFSPTALA